MYVLLGLLLLLEPAPIPMEFVSETELDRLAAEIARGLNNPRLDPDDTDRLTTSYYSDLTIASVWPRKEFKPGLLKALDHESTKIVPLAAKGLLNYGRSDLRGRVERLKGDERRCSMGCFVWDLGSEITRSIEDVDTGRAFHCDGQCLLPFDRKLTSLRLDVPVEAGESPGAMTVDRAVVALRDDSLCIRLQAFAWLDDKGIVLDTAPLEEAWPRLDVFERRALVSKAFGQSTRLGTSRLRTALEKILQLRSDEMSDQVLGAILIRLSSLESEVARQTALEVIAGYADEPISNEHLAPPLLGKAFRAFCRHVRKEDRERGAIWAADKRHVYRSAGLYVLAHFDDAEAVKTVCRAVEQLSYKGKEAICNPEPLYAISKREWPDPKSKSPYIRAIIRAFKNQGKRSSIPAWPDRFRIASCINTLESLTGEFKGETGWRTPSGFDEEILRQTMANWVSWLEENKPDE